MIKRRFVILLFALIGAVLGAAFGALAAPTSQRYTASVNVALTPGPDLTTAESSSFWEVLTRGQISRTAAIVYEDSRWLTSAAKAANVRQSELTLSANALPDTSVLSVSVTANSSAAAEAALSDVLTTASAEVASVTAPFLAKTLSPTEGSARRVPVPGKAQFAAAGALAGLLGGGSVGWYFLRRRGGSRLAHDQPTDIVETDAVDQGYAAHQHDPLGQNDAVVGNRAKHSA
ncbi:hypothetical protein [Mycobacterium lehmannii]|uniref:hypothetical protein n=1 Tax=Mycobacterium lehmannii TaxID=2048550 RepID=UPI0010567711|nr:hypothetical protein [Mycobacterium lehmannii]